jgi:hypothetical protein
VNCEGVGETRRDGKAVFFCTAIKERERRVYSEEKEDVVCPPDLQLICLARSRIWGAQKIGHKEAGKKTNRTEREKSKFKPPKIIR